MKYWRKRCSMPGRYCIGEVRMSAPRKSLWQAMRQCDRRVDGCRGKRIVHGDSHALGSAHLNEVVVYECDFRQLNLETFWVLKV